MNDLKITAPIDPSNVFGFSEAELKLINNIPSIALKNNTTVSPERIFKQLTLKNTEINERQLRDYITLLYSSNLSPIKCAELCGMSWTAILKHAERLERDNDNELSEAIKFSKRAFAEFIMFHPEQYQGNSSMAIFIAKSQAGWTDNSENIFGVPSEQELDQILKAREELIEEYQKLQKTA